MISINGHPPNGQCKHLLFALLFLKMYGTEEQNRSIIGLNEKTFRFWVWKYVECLSKLDLVSI